MQLGEMLRTILGTHWAVVPHKLWLFLGLELGFQSINQSTNQNLYSGLNGNRHNKGQFG